MVSQNHPGKAVKQPQMRFQIFQRIVFVCTLVLVIAMLLVIFSVYHSFSVLFEDSLQSEVRAVAGLVEQSEDDGLSLLEGLQSDRRLTLVDSDGTVLYDSMLSSSDMGNHSDREEIREARESEDGLGVSVRSSDSISAHTVNVAQRLSDGRILRICDSRNTPYTMIGGIVGTFVCILALVLVLSFLLAARMSRSITEPLNHIDLECPKKAEVYEELNPLLQRIESQNQQIVRQLADLKIEHEKQDAMRRDFTANVTHELKTPLTSISGYAEIIRNGIAQPEDIPRFAGKICDESKRLISLVGDILKLSKLDEGRAGEVPAQVDLYEICREELSLMELPAAGQNVSLHLEGEPLYITSQKQILQEIIFNLLDNAVKYNRPGGEVRLRLRQCVDGAELTVTDTGIGIPAEDQEHVFERFYRVDKSHSREIGGTGLGLSIVKHGARTIGATLSLESTVGVGTTVRILF